MILLKNGHVVDPAQNLNGTADILIEGQTIQAVGQNLEAPGAQIIDLQGKVVMPGFIDLHVHLREPGREGGHPDRPCCRRRRRLYCHCLYAQHHSCGR